MIAGGPTSWFATPIVFFEVPHEVCFVAGSVLNFEIWWFFGVSKSENILINSESASHLSWLKFSQVVQVAESDSACKIDQIECVGNWNWDYL